MMAGSAATLLFGVTGCRMAVDPVTAAKASDRLRLTDETDKTQFRAKSTLHRQFPDEFSNKGVGIWPALFMTNDVYGEKAGIAMPAQKKRTAGVLALPSPSGFSSNKEVSPLFDAALHRDDDSGFFAAPGDAHRDETTRLRITCNLPPRIFGSSHNRISNPEVKR